jgi:hypothetical protein
MLLPVIYTVGFCTTGYALFEVCTAKILKYAIICLKPVFRSGHMVGVARESKLSGNIFHNGPSLFARESSISHY